MKRTGPVLIDAQIDKDERVLPMIPAGGTVDDLVTGIRKEIMEKYILSVTVQNNAGVLARVSALFGRRGYNIDSLTVSATTDPKVFCMSIIVQGDHMVLEQIMKQLAKLEEVMRCTPRRRQLLLQ